MPIPGIEQPELLPIDSTLRLRRYDGRHSFAYRWYQDVETVRLVDGVETPYTEEKLARMYRYLDAHGELYFIEQKGEDGFVPIGDVTLCPEDLPIVIGERTCRGQKVGRAGGARPAAGLGGGVRAGDLRLQHRLPQMF